MFKITREEKFVLVKLFCIMILILHFIFLSLSKYLIFTIYPLIYLLALNVVHSLPVLVDYQPGEIRLLTLSI